MEDNKFLEENQVQQVSGGSGTSSASGAPRCPECGSVNLKFTGSFYDRKTKIRTHYYKCLDCGKDFSV